MKANAYFVIIAIALISSPGYAKELGAQQAAEINFSDDVVTQAEIDVADQFATPSIKPDSPFYVLKRFWESVRYAFASNEDKARLHLSFAKERLAEANYLVKKNKTDEAVKRINEFGEELNKSQSIGPNASAIAKETEDTALKSALVLELVKQKVPERAKPAIQRAIDNSLEKKARIKAERKISGEIEVRETNQPPPGILVAETLPVPSTKEELIEKEAGKEIVQETKRQEKRRQSIEAVKERLGALKTDIAIRP